MMRHDDVFDTRHTTHVVSIILRLACLTLRCADDPLPNMLLWQGIVFCLLGLLLGIAPPALGDQDRNAFILIGVDVYQIQQLIRSCLIEDANATRILVIDDGALDRPSQASKGAVQECHLSHQIATLSITCGNIIKAIWISMNSTM